MENSKSNIFCPNCGGNNKIEQNFCRFCSLHLRETAKSLSAQISTGQNAGQLKKLEAIKKASDFVSIGLMVVVGALIFVYLYNFFTGAAFSGGRLFLGLAVLFIILQSVLGYFRRANTLGYAEEMEKTNSLLQRDYEEKTTAKLLEDKPFEPVVRESVTENSTELLFVENKTRKLE